MIQNTEIEMQGAPYCMWQVIKADGNTMSVLFR